VSAPPMHPSTTEEIAVSDLPDGTRLVQLGAFDTAEIAREEWDRIAGRFPEYFDDRPRVIEEAESGRADLLSPAGRRVRRPRGVAPLLRGSGGTGNGLYTGHSALSLGPFCDDPRA
jgi:hypothetical protein